MSRHWTHWSCLQQNIDKAVKISETLKLSRHSVTSQKTDGLLSPAELAQNRNMYNKCYEISETVITKQTKNNNNFNLIKRVVSLLQQRRYMTQDIDKLTRYMSVNNTAQCLKAYKTCQKLQHQKHKLLAAKMHTLATYTYT